MAGFAHALVVCLAASAAKTSVAGASREDKVFELALASGRIKQGPRSPNPPYRKLDIRCVQFTKFSRCCHPFGDKGYWINVNSLLIQ